VRGHLALIASRADGGGDKAVIHAATIDVPADELPLIVVPKHLREGRLGIRDEGEDPARIDKTLRVSTSHNLALIVDAQRLGSQRSRHIEGRKDLAVLQESAVE
jgi:hypothetical protein